MVSARGGKGLGLFLVGVMGLAAFVACDETIEATKSAPDAGATDATVDAPASETSTPPGGDAGPDAQPDAATAVAVARGKYIVENLAGCGDCHTPRDNTGAPIAAKFLSGIECFIGVDLTTLDAGSDAGDAGDAGTPPPGPPGCLHSRNLTNDPTGLANRTDQEIKNMFQHGIRPAGGALAPVMPYWMYANMTDADANAIVAYLRTVPAVSHALPANQAPWSFITAPVPAIDLTTVPAAPTANDAAARGRYLATAVSACVDCHTREVTPGAGGFDTSKWFAGSRVFPSAAFGLPTPPFPAIIYSANLTSDATGMAAYSPAEIAAVIRLGKDRDGGNVCPPMPVGPHGPFGGMTEADALDIATYVKSLPAIALARPNDCLAP